MSSFNDASTAHDDDGEWEEMPVVRSAASQMPKSDFQDLDDDEEKKYKYRPPSPTTVDVGGGYYSYSNASASTSTSTSTSAAGRRNSAALRASRTGNATGRNLDIDDARGYNWRAKPAGHDDGAGAGGQRHRERDSDEDSDDADDDDDGGAAKGYTQLRIDEDEEAEHLHAATEYLFGGAADSIPGQDLPSATPLSQLATTKQLLTEGQKIAYVGLCSLATREMVRRLERLPGKEAGLVAARSSANEWRVRVMARLYQHMDIDSSEQNMIDSLAQHGVLIEDLAPSLITTHTVQNPDYDPRAAELEKDAAAATAAVKLAEPESSTPAPAPAHHSTALDSAALQNGESGSRSDDTANTAKGHPDAQPSTTSTPPGDDAETDIGGEIAATDLHEVEEEGAEHARSPTPSEPTTTLQNGSPILPEADIGQFDGELADGDITGADDSGGDIGMMSNGPEAAARRPKHQRSGSAASTSAESTQGLGHLPSVLDDSGDLASSDALSVPQPPEPSDAPDDKSALGEGALRDEDITTPKGPASRSLAEDAPSTDPNLAPGPEPPEKHEKKGPILVDPNTAGQIDSQLDNLRPALPVGKNLGLTAEPIPIEPPPAALEGVTTSLSIADKDITLDIRWTVLCDLFLVLTADSVYDARSRVLLERIADALSLTWMDVTQFEKRVTDALEIEEGVDKLRNRKAIAQREKVARKKRYVMMGLATVGGGLVIGLSAGLLAPVIGAGLGAALGAVGIGGTTTFLGGVGGAAIITTTGTLAGAGVAGKGMSRRTRSVKTFEFKVVHNNKRVNCIVGMPGFMNGAQDDVRLPFSVLDSIMGDVLSVLWDPDMMQEMGNSMSILWNETLTQGVQQILALTVAGGLVGSLTWPMWLLKLGYFIDNPWSNALDRAKAAGLILADVLAKRQLGVRPITLVGFSLGARAIFYALVELSRLKAFGVVQNVYIMGTPVTASDAVWKEARSVVAGRFVNVFSRSDWILGYLYRATSGGLRSIAGLHPVERLPDVENVDVTHIIPGHLAYRALMPLVLNELGFRTTADFFDEPVDLDKIPSRQVVDEEEEAPPPEEKPSGFAKLFRRDHSKDASAAKAGARSSQTGDKSTSSGSKAADKQPPSQQQHPIEEYEDDDLPERLEHPAHAPVAPLPQLGSIPSSIQSDPSSSSTSSAGTPTRLGMPSPHFDADAILAELRESGIQVRELQSSLPPLVASPVNPTAPESIRPPLPSKGSSLHVYNPPSPVHDRSRANSFATPPSSSLLAAPPSVSAGSGGFGASTTDLSATPTPTPSPTKPATSPGLKSASSVTFNQQEDYGTSRDRGLSRQLPSIPPANDFAASDLQRANVSAASPSVQRTTFGNFGSSSSSTASVWGSPMPSTPATGGLDDLPLPIPEPTLTFGGEDGELSMDLSSPKAETATPWSADNPWN